MKSIVAICIGIGMVILGVNVQVPESSIPPKSESMAFDTGAEIKNEIGKLDSADARIRLDAVYKLGITQKEEAVAAVPQLIEMLSDAAPLHQRLTIFELATVGTETAGILAKIGKEAVDPLIAALDDQRPVVRANAALALGYIKDAKSVPHLIRLLDDEYAYVRSKAVMALAQINSPMVIEAFIIALLDEEAEVRSQAVRALVKEGNRAKVAIMSSLNDEHWHVQSEAALALEPEKI